MKDSDGSNLQRKVVVKIVTYKNNLFRNPMAYHTGIKMIIMGKLQDTFTGRKITMNKE